MVKFNVTALSHPAAFVVVQVGVVVDEVYNTPCHLSESQDVIVSVDDVGCFIVRCKVSVDAHPFALV
jgi:hypothetical protein